MRFSILKIRKLTADVGKILAVFLFAPYNFIFTGFVTKRNLIPAIIDGVYRDKDFNNEFALFNFF